MAGILSMLSPGHPYMSGSIRISSGACNQVRQVTWWLCSSHGSSKQSRKYSEVIEIYSTSAPVAVVADSLLLFVWLYNSDRLSKVNIPRIQSLLL